MVNNGCCGGSKLSRRSSRTDDGDDDRGDQDAGGGADACCPKSTLRCLMICPDDAGCGAQAVGCRRSRPDVAQRCSAAANQKADALWRLERQCARAGRQAQMGAAVALMTLDDAVLDDSEVREPRSRVDDGGAQRVLVASQDARHSGRARRESRHDDRVDARPITVAVRLHGGGRAR